MRRRSLLSLLATGPFLGGCAGRTPASEPSNATTPSSGSTTTVSTTTATETATPQPTSAPATPRSPAELATPDSVDCADTEPLGEYFDSAGGSGDVTHNRADGFVLSASPSAVSKGEALVLTLENVSAETLETGGYGQFAIQRRTDDGWKHVLSLRRSNFTSIAFRHRPGGGFRWAFTVSERGFSKGQYTMCTPLKPGEYRFVYWGLSGEKAVATRFRIGE